MHQAARTRRLLPRAPWTALGPAFVAGIAYVDPGNVATNSLAGARYGYLLVWVVVIANALAIFVQYLSAKLGVATGRSLPRLCREHYPRAPRVMLWLQAEGVALATDLAEILGGAIALNLLFGIPVLSGGAITGVVSLAILGLQSPRRQRRFERVILGMLAVIAIGFVWSAFAVDPQVSPAVAGLVPRFEGVDSLLIATGMLGATVMPHAVYLHSALVVDRFRTVQADERRRSRLLAATRADVTAAMAVAGAVNLAMVFIGAGLVLDPDSATIDGVVAGLHDQSSALTATLFAVALLASGFASSSVGTYAGAVILEGFVDRRLPLLVRRGVTLVPALGVLAMGTDPSSALVMSQVVLSFGIPFALFPLVGFTRRADIMGSLVNRRLTTVCALASASAISILNVVLLILTFAG